MGTVGSSSDDEREGERHEKRLHSAGAELASAILRPAVRQRVLREYGSVDMSQSVPASALRPSQLFGGIFENDGGEQEQQQQQDEPQQQKDKQQEQHMPSFEEMVKAVMESAMKKQQDRIDDLEANSAKLATSFNRRNDELKGEVQDLLATFGDDMARVDKFLQSLNSRLEDLAANGGSQIRNITNIMKAEMEALQQQLNQNPIPATVTKVKAAVMVDVKGIERKLDAFIKDLAVLKEQFAAGMGAGGSADEMTALQQQVAGILEQLVQQPARSDAFAAAGGFEDSHRKE